MADDSPRARGNAAYAAGDLQGALALYALAADGGDHLAASNAAQVCSDLRWPAAALAWADRALTAEPTHTKSLLRRARALVALGRYMDALVATRDGALAGVPDVASVAAAARRGVAESAGQYDWAALLEHAHRHPTKPLPIVADFTHADVEVAPVPGRGLGVRAKRPLPAGTLVVAARPVAMVWPHEAKGSATGGGDSRVTACEWARGKPDRVLLLQRLQRLLSDGRDGANEAAAAARAAVRALCRPGDASGVGAGADATVPDDDVAVLVAEANAYGLSQLLERGAVEGAATSSGSAGDDDNAAGEPPGVGLWAVPSRFNHSCAPSCGWAHLGDVMLVRTARPVGAGEELTVSYVAVDGGLAAGVQRYRRLKGGWGFTCGCPLCRETERLVITPAKEGRKPLLTPATAWRWDPLPQALRAAVVEGAPHAVPLMLQHARGVHKALAAQERADGGSLGEPLAAMCNDALSVCAAAGKLFSSAGHYAHAIPQYEAAYECCVAPGLTGLTAEDAAKAALLSAAYHARLHARGERPPDDDDGNGDAALTPHDRVQRWLDRAADAFRVAFPSLAAVRHLEFYRVMTAGVVEDMPGLSLAAWTPPPSSPPLAVAAAAAAK